LPLTGKARSVQRTLEPLDDRLTSRPEETTMTTDEAARPRLYQRAREVLGDDTADTLMDSLPPDRDQLATKTDVSALRGDLGALDTNLRGEMATLAANLRGEMATLAANLRGEMATLEANLRSEMATLEANLRSEMATLDANLRAEMATLDATLRSEVTHLRSEMAALEANLRSDVATLGSDLRVEILDATNGLLRTLFFGMVGTNATLVGLVFAAVRLA
jgi:hypothetical protein